MQSKDPLQCRSTSGHSRHFNSIFEFRLAEERNSRMFSHRLAINAGYKTRTDTPTEESVAAALLSNETNVAAPNHFPS
jgi:hypothetical protein